MERNWNCIWRTEMEVENANTVNCRCRCRYKSCQMNKRKEFNLNYLYLIYKTKIYYNTINLFPNRRSLKGSNAIIQLGYSGPTAPKVPCDSGFRGFPGFRRVPDRRIPEGSTGFQAPMGSQGLSRVPRILKNSRGSKVLKFPKDPKL